MELKRFLNGDGKDRRRLSVWGNAVIQYVGESLRASDYLGPFGIDALVLKREDELALYPVVEVNPRATMGRVALALRSSFDPKGQRGVRLQVYPNLKALLDSLKCSKDELSALTSESALEGQWNERGCWRGDLLPLTDLWSILELDGEDSQRPIVALITS